MAASGSATAPIAAFVSVEDRGAGLTTSYATRTHGCRRSLDKRAARKIRSVELACRVCNAG